MGGVPGGAGAEGGQGQALVVQGSSRHAGEPGRGSSWPCEAPSHGRLAPLAQAAVHGLLMELHAQAATAGSATGSLQVRGHAHQPCCRHRCCCCCCCWRRPSCSASPCSLAPPPPILPPQAARCLEHGLLVPQDHGAAFRRYREAAAAGSAEGALRCGIHFFEGTAPGGARRAVCTRAGGLVSARGGPGRGGGGDKPVRRGLLATS